MSATVWSYQPPTRPASHPSQCYYRAGACYGLKIEDAGPDTPDVTVYRTAENEHVALSISAGHARLSIDIDAPALRVLIDAFRDALQDIDAVAGERERRESFEGIQEELSQLEDGQAPGVYYGHPDVHYVPADQVAAKVRELEAAGVARYLVMPEPATGSAS